MAKTTGPLFSLGARQSLASTLTYATWRGIPYVRQLVIPSNPRTTSQTNARNRFKTLSDMYTRFPAILLEPFEANAEGQPYTAKNRFFKINIPLINGQTDLQDLVLGTIANGGIPPLTVVSSDAGSQDLTLTATQPTLPTGWTQVAFQAAAILDGNPTTPVIRTPVAGEDTAAAYTVVTLNFTAAGTYVWAGWNKFTKPDGSTAYSAPVVGTQVIA